MWDVLPAVHRVIKLIGMRKRQYKWRGGSERQSAVCESDLLWLKVWILTRWCVYFCRIFLVSSSVLKEFISTKGTSALKVLFRC